MREFINIVENEANIPDAYEIVRKYVTHGDWTSPTAFDRPLTKLMQLLPRPTHSETLYRVLRLTPEQLNAYQQRKLVLEPRRFSSWTKDEKIAERLALVKGDNCIILKATFPPEHIVIDVEEFYGENEFDNFEFPEYHKYVVKEMEVIVYNDKPFVVTSENSRLFKANVYNPPNEGDQLFVPDYDDYVIIDSVDANQPYSGRGVFSVTGTDGYEYWVRSVGDNEWEDVGGDVE